MRAGAEAGMDEQGFVCGFARSGVSVNAAVKVSKSAEVKFLSLAGQAVVVA